jgi:hypothetical protein
MASSSMISSVFFFMHRLFHALSARGRHDAGSASLCLAVLSTSDVHLPMRSTRLLDDGQAQAGAGDTVGAAAEEGIEDPGDRCSGAPCRFRCRRSRSRRRPSSVSLRRAVSVPPVRHGVVRVLHQVEEEIMRISASSASTRD